MRDTRIATKSLKTTAALCLATAMMLAGAVGCENGKNKTGKEQATERWNHARAGVQTSLAQDQYRAGNFEKCRQTIDEGLKLDPQNPALHMLSAKLAIEQGQLELAERELALTRSLAPNDAEPYYLSGVVFQRWQKPETAYQFYKTAGEKAPAELAFLMAEAEMLVAMDRAPEALSMLQAKVTYFENSAAIRDAVGQLLLQAKRYPEAVEMFRQASILSQEDASYKERLALSLYYAKQYRDAATELSLLIAKEPFSRRSDLLAALGECQLRTGRPREARISFDAATQISPSSANLWLGLGRAALEVKDLKRADLALRKAELLDGSSAETHLMIGYLRLRQNRATDALNAFTKATTLDRTDTVALCMVGYAFEKLGRADAAMQCYAKALKIKPGDEMASQLMAGVDLND